MTKPTKYLEGRTGWGAEGPVPLTPTALPPPAAGFPGEPTPAFRVIKGPSALPTSEAPPTLLNGLTGCFGGSKVSDLEVHASRGQLLPRGSRVSGRVAWAWKAAQMTSFVPKQQGFPGGNPVRARATSPSLEKLWMS